MMMTRNDKILCAIYALIAVGSLVATWSNNLAWLAQPGDKTPESLYRDLYVNYTTASFVNDLFGLGIAAGVFMVVEARRLKIRYVWAYILFSGPTAISFTFPLFMIARQMAMARKSSNLTPDPSPSL